MSTHSRHAPLSPCPRAKGNGRIAPPVKPRHPYHAPESGRSGRPMSPISQSRTDDKQRNHSTKGHRGDEKVCRTLNHHPKPTKRTEHEFVIFRTTQYSSHVDKEMPRERMHSSRPHVIESSPHHEPAKHSMSRSKASRPQTSEYSRAKNPPEPIDASPSSKKKPKEKTVGKVNATASGGRTMY